MLGRTPVDVQAQLAEAVTLLAEHDFPRQWQGLLPQLSQALLQQDVAVTHGVMLTANRCALAPLVGLVAFMRMYPNPCLLTPPTLPPPRAAS